MKLIIVLLFAGLMQVSAAGFAQKITLNQKNAPLKEVLTQIRLQSGYNILYDADLLKNAGRVNVNLKDASIEEALKSALSEQKIGYTIKEQTVILAEKKPSFLEGMINAFNRIDINGHVVNPDGTPIMGATVTVKGTRRTGFTDANGSFSFSGLDEGATLVISYIGYVNREISAKANLGRIVLEPGNNPLDEIQVIAYGTTTKRTNTGDVSTIDAKTLAKYPTTNALDALQGNVPGLNIYKNTGNANSSYKVQIRGINGLNNGQPLYIIDGIPYKGGPSDTQNLNLGTGTANGSNYMGYDGLSAINPDDIESISILKDAGATAIYGSRGADGVILITTKKGKAGAAKVDASVYSGVGDVGRSQPMLNLQQYLQMRREAKANDKTAILPTDYDINGVWDNTRSTDWQKELIGGFSNITKAQLAVSGGSEQVQFRLSAGYNSSTNVSDLAGSDRTASLNANINSTSKDKKFSLSFSGGYLYEINTMPPSDLTGSINLAPDAPSLYTPSGALNFENNTFSNPLVLRNNINSSPNDNLTSSLILSYKPIADLEIKLTSGYNRQNLNEYLGTPTTAAAPFQNFPSYSTFTYNKASIWSIEPQLNYQKQIAKGTLQATLGASLQDQKYSTMSLQGSGYSSDLLLSSLTAGTSITVVNPYTVSPKKFSALFARVNYNWAGKYFLDLTGRNDGSSNFGENKQFHLFAAAGAGWIFSEENFIKNNLSFLSFGKLRGSYGTTGRDNITPYSYLSTYSNLKSVLAYGGVAGIMPTSLPNPDLSWETTKKAELGLELQFLKGRIAFETNFYRNRTTDVLSGDLLSAVTGFNSINRNLPATVQNQGFDMSLTTSNIKSKNFSWSTTILFTRDRNKLVQYPGLATSSYANLYVIGQPVNIVKAYRFAGVNPLTGIYQVYAANGSIATSPNSVADKTVLINVNPDFYGSVQNNITYKQFSLSFLFRYIKQTGKNVFGTMGFFPPGSSANMNFPTLVLDRWQKPGDITNVQRYGTNSQLLQAQNYATQSDAGYGDASFVRLQNLSFSYSFPQTVIHKLGMQNLQVFLQGDNLLTITGYKGLDPENQTKTALPPLRIMTAGLRLTL